MLSNYRWQLLASFDYYVGAHPESSIIPKESIIRVPTGTITDLASVPRILWAVFPPHGKYAKAAIVHDYLYQQSIGSKDWADRVFLEAMAVLGVPRLSRTLMYWSVRLFGRGNYSRL